MAITAPRPTTDVKGALRPIRKNIDWKFYLLAISNNTVDMTVGDDYTAVFTAPNGEDKSVNRASVTLTAKMQNVGSLGVTGVREHSVTINTGIAGVTADLGTWLSNCYSFHWHDCQCRDRRQALHL